MSKSGVLSYQEEVRKREANLATLEEYAMGRKRGWLPFIGNILKFPIAVMGSFGGWTIGSLVGGAYSTGTLTAAALTTCTVPVIGAGVGGVLIFGGWTIKSLQQISALDHQDKIKEIELGSSALLREKIELMDTANKNEVIDFFFNRKSLLNTPEKKIVNPLKMTDTTCSQLMDLFMSKKVGELKFGEINISEASLSDKQLDLLLTMGLGKYHVKKLVLSDNNLTDAAIDALHKKIIKKGAFSTLKSLDLSGNQLSSASLEKIADIARHLKLESLNLSGNSLKQTSESEENKLDKFFYFHLNNLPYLKKLELRKIGLSNARRQALRAFLSGLNGVESLDLRDNPELTLTCYREYLLKDGRGLHLNLSLRELKTDEDKWLDIDQILKKTAHLFSNIGYQEGPKSRLLFLLEEIEKNGCLPKLSMVCAGKAAILLQNTIHTIKERKIVNHDEWLSVLSMEHENLYRMPPDATEEKGQGPVLYQYSPQPSFVEEPVRVLLDLGNGLKWLMNQKDIFLVNLNTSKKYKPDLSQILQRLKENEDAIESLPGQSSKGEQIAIMLGTSPDPIRFVKETLKEEGSVQELLSVGDLPQAIFRYNPRSWANSYEEVANITFQDAAESTPRLAS